MRRRAAEEGAVSDNDCSQLNNNKQKRKGKSKGRFGPNGALGDDEDEAEGVSNLSPEKQLTCSLILQEINSKMSTVAWKPM